MAHCSARRRSVDIGEEGCAVWRPVSYESWVEQDDGATILGVRGELDVSTERQFRRELEELVYGKPLVVVDLSEVTFIDVSTIRGLEHCSALARARGGRLVVASSSRLVRRVFDILELSQHMFIAGSRQDALRFLRQPDGSSCGVPRTTGNRQSTPASMQRTCGAEAVTGRGA